MQYIKTFIVGLLFTCCVKLTAQSTSAPPLLVSLGCSCEVAHELRWNEKRDRAFPFDWLLTTDCAKFVSLLEDDFKFFMDKRFLTIESPDHPTLFNSFYNIEFRHDLYDMDTSFEDYLPVIQEKYRRRIERFRDLRNYSGKVYFIRSAYPPGYDHSQSIVTKECLALTYTHTESLRNALIHLFPDLDFNLIIINYEAMPCPKIANLDRVIEFKIGIEKNFTDVLRYCR